MGQWPVRSQSSGRPASEEPSQGPPEEPWELKGQGSKGWGNSQASRDPEGQANPKEPLQAAIIPALLPAIAPLVTSLPKAYPVRTTSAVTWGEAREGALWTFLIIQLSLARGRHGMNELRKSPDPGSGAP